jgi:hypothetical protein
MKKGSPERPDPAESTEVTSHEDVVTRPPRGGRLPFTPALAFLPGCLGEDSSPDEATLNEAENGVSAAASELALQTDQSLIASIPGWMSNGVAPFRDGTTAYDSTSQTWVITFSEDYTTAQATGHLESTHRVQFLKDGTPVQFDDGTNQMQVTVEATNVGTITPRTPGMSISTTR